jgi:Methyltransferase domain
MTSSDHAAWLSPIQVSWMPRGSYRSRRINARPEALLGGTANLLPFDSNVFRGVWVSQVLHHVSDLGGCANELRRVLIRGGARPRQRNVRRLRLQELRPDLASSLTPPSLLSQPPLLYQLRGSRKQKPESTANVRTPSTAEDAVLPSAAPLEDRLEGGTVLNTGALAVRPRLVALIITCLTTTASAMMLTVVTGTMVARADTLGTPAYQFSGKDIYAPDVLKDPME